MASPSSPKKVVKPSIKDIITSIHKTFGEEAVVDMTKITGTHPSISTGFSNIDDIIGVGGFPKGRIIELYGPEHSGKSTLAIHVAALAQKEPEGFVVYVDYEHAFDPRYARKLGLDVDDVNKFLLVQPPNLEEGMAIAQRFIEAGVATMVIVDSIAAAPPQAEVEGDAIGGNRIGLHSLVWANVLKKITHTVHTSDCVFVGINQVRTKIGVTWGSGETTPGGNAWKHYASLRVKLTKTQGVKGKYVNELGVKEDVVSATKVRVSISKNKMAQPFRETEILLRHGEGFDVTGGLVDEALTKGILTKTAQGWIFWGEKDTPGFLQLRGAELFAKHLKENPEDMKRLQQECAKTEFPTSGTVEF